MAARHHVQKHFALQAVVERYQAIYASLATGRLQSVPSPSLSEWAQ
jgi:hypothetical protein